ncbi:MAG: hypothetical protein HY291_15155 [Planctomycetes bacterium]|nr:hypothetical protein [Planctomycetota bacterium]
MRNAIQCIPVLTLVLCAGCSNSEKKTADAKTELTQEEKDAAKKADLEALKKKYEAQPVDPKRLQEFFPEGTAEFAKGQPTGSIEPSGNDKTSKATVVYGKEPHTIRVDIVDFANAKKKIDDAYWWTTRSVDNKLKDGYEKTGYVMQLFKTYEHQSIEKKTSQYLICVGERFIISAEATDVEMPAVKAIVDKIDYRKLSTTK